MANRIFSSLYTSMRARDAVEILEAALSSGDGPPAIGAQIARRAGIAASEMRGTYEGLWLLDRADEHASSAPSPEEQLAKTASIRAEMHLDAGEMELAEREARRALDLDPEGSIRRQATRTLADVYTSQGRFAEAAQAAGDALPARMSRDERWIDLSARTLLARIALEQGRIAEAVAGTRAVVLEARELAEDRVGLLAETLLRGLDPTWAAHRGRPRRACRGPYASRCSPRTVATCCVRGELRQAAGLAADVVALADSARLGSRQRRGTAAARPGARRPRRPRPGHHDVPHRPRPLPHHAAPAARRRRARRARRGRARPASSPRRGRWRPPPSRCARRAWPCAGATPPTTTWCRRAGRPRGGSTATTSPPTPSPSSRAVFNRPASAPPSVLDQLTAAERLVAERVAQGLTSRAIAEELFVSPRTVDAHLTHIYRKLDINTRARLAGLVTEQTHAARPRLRSRRVGGVAAGCRA